VRILFNQLTQEVDYERYNSRVIDLFDFVYGVCGRSHKLNMVDIRMINRVSRISALLYGSVEWNEEMGDCLFLAFLTFEEPPQVFCGTPLDSTFKEFKEMFDIEWTHFIRLDFNNLIDQAMSKP